VLKVVPVFGERILHVGALESMAACVIKGVITIVANIGVRAIKPSRRCDMVFLSSISFSLKFNFLKTS
jgi:hypothetical protein